jgi:hypothetical protein
MMKLPLLCQTLLKLVCPKRRGERRKAVVVALDICDGKLEHVKLHPDRDIQACIKFDVPKDLSNFGANIQRCISYKKRRA